MTQDTLTPRSAWGMGLLAVTCGVMPILGGLGVISGARASVPFWVPIVAGAMFVLAGVSIIITYGVTGGLDADGGPRPGTPYAVQIIQYLLILAIIGGMGAVASWVAFGPGDRAFGVGIGTGGVGAGGVSHSPIGRIVFGIGAALTGAMFVYAAVSGARRLRTTRRTARRDHA
jgi:hypothetical protein